MPNTFLVALADPIIAGALGVVLGCVVVLCVCAGMAIGYARGRRDGRSAEIARRLADAMREAEETAPMRVVRLHAVPSANDEGEGAA